MDGSPNLYKLYFIYQYHFSDKLFRIYRNNPTTWVPASHLALLDESPEMAYFPNKTTYYFTYWVGALVECCLRTPSSSVPLGLLPRLLGLGTSLTHLASVEQRNPSYVLRVSRPPDNKSPLIFFLQSPRNW